jgi:hypothetical protein
VQAESQEFLHACRIQHRNHCGRHHRLALVRQRRGLAGVIVTHYGNHTAELGGAGCIGVLEHIHAAIDAGAFAIPDAEHPLDIRFGRQDHLLRAPQAGCGNVLVHARHEMNLVCRKVLFGLPQGFVVLPERGAAVSGNEAGRVQAGSAVPLALEHRQAHQGLNPGHEGRAIEPGVFVVELDLSHLCAPGRKVLPKFCAPWVTASGPAYRGLCGRTRQSGIAPPSP